MAHFDHEGDPTKEELLTYARLRDAGRFGDMPERAQDLVLDLCYAHYGAFGPCNHTHDAFSLALDGEDVDELL